MPSPAPVSSTSKDRVKDVTDYLFSLHALGIRPGLDRISALLASIGDPHKRYPCVHVAGTNGKGSTSAMLAAMLSHSGYATGLYTSPHLLDFRERIRVGDKMISARALVRIAENLRAKAESLKISPTFFEFTTAIALSFFAEKKVDIAVIETGLGGRLDATNVITPLVSVVTNVGLEHTDILGHTIEKIAFEKAGIIKRHAPVVTGERKREALRAIRTRAKEMNSPVYSLGSKIKITVHKDRFDYSGIDRTIKELCPSLLGEHQFQNAALAISAIELLCQRGFSVPLKAIKDGISNTTWPGRMEVVSNKPLLLLDCAHNPHGARALKKALGRLEYKNLTLVLGIMADKEIGEILAPLAPLAQRIIVGSPSIERSARPGAIIDALGRHAKKASAAKSIAKACALALSCSGPKDAVVVTGSIYTVAEAKGWITRRRRKNPR